jgi:hypothetical protein
MSEGTRSASWNTLLNSAAISCGQKIMKRNKRSQSPLPLTGFTNQLAHQWEDQDPVSLQSENSDQDLHQSENSDLDPYQSEKSDLNPRINKA